MHPVAEQLATIRARIDCLVEQKLVTKRAHADYTLFKYNDAPTILGDARLARGLLVIQDRIVNLPLPKYDEMVSYTECSDTYWSSVRKALPKPPYILQPKLDGTCIHALFDKGKLIVHTLLSMNNAQVKAARSYLEGSEWRPGLTLAFELISPDDPKVQQKRTTGLTLLYGADMRTGFELTRAELDAISKDINIPLVKQNTIQSRDKLMTFLRGLDDVESIVDIKEGIVLTDKSGKRHKVKTHSYLQLAAMKTIPTRTWLCRLLRNCKTMDEMHEQVEMVDGPKDTAILARKLLVEMIHFASDRLQRATSICDESINAIREEKDDAMRTIRFALLKDPTVYDGDALKLLNVVAKAFAHA